MAYDEDLAERLRAVLAEHDGLTERRMFGGLGFMVRGHMVVAARSDGGLLLRCHPDETATHAEQPGVDPTVMRGSPVRGWLAVGREVVAEDDDLARWVSVGTAFAATLPPK